MTEERKNKTPNEVKTIMAKHNRNRAEARLTKEAMVRVINSRFVQQADLEHCNHITLMAIRNVIETLEAERDMYKAEVLNVMKLKGFKC